MTIRNWTLVLLFLSGTAVASQKAPRLSDHERLALKACETIVSLFERSGDEIWPGFDLSKQPFLVYIPGRWALLVNQTDSADFGPVPRDWPLLHMTASYRAGQYRDLIGQLAFDVDVGGREIAALGLSEGQFGTASPRSYTMLGFIVHEAFHQFQNETFGEIAWEREERYPILNPDNSVLAALEMRILNDAVAAALRGRRDQAQSLLKMFVAVRTDRWSSAPPFVRRYEQGQEIREGTAAYVEKKSLDLVRRLGIESTPGGLTASVLRDPVPLPIAELFRQDFRFRTTGGAVSPDDMIRNRIYPVGSALGYLADLWDPGWKRSLAANVGSFSFGDFFKRQLNLSAPDLQAAAEAARGKYDYPGTRRDATKLIAAHRSGYEGDKATFDAQRGTQIVVHVRYRTMSRSRSSQGRSWVVDDGGKTLQTNVRVYSLKMDGFSLQVRDRAIYEENDWDVRDKRVTFFVPESPSILLNGARAEAGGMRSPASFRTLELSAPGLSLAAGIAGALTVERGRVTVDLGLPSP